MINLNPLSPIRPSTETHQTHKTKEGRLEQQAINQVEAAGHGRKARRDRRRMPDRRSRKASEKIDRRQGLERRRNSIDITV